MSHPVSYEKGRITYTKVDSRAEAPHKTNAQDGGWHLTFIGRKDNRAEDDVGRVTEFRTGLNLTAPYGFHLEVVASPQLYRHGYMIPSGTHYVGTQSNGELIVPLYKFQEGDDLALPFRACMLVVRPTPYMHLARPPRKVAAGNGLYTEEAPSTDFRDSRVAGTMRPVAIPPSNGNHMY